MDFQRKMVVWGSVDTMKQFDEVKRFATASEDDQTVGWLASHVKLYGKLLLAMRKDIGLPCRGLDEETFGPRYMLRHPEILLEAVKEDPSMSVDELTKREKEFAS